MATGSESRQITSNVEHLDMPAFSFQFGHSATRRNIACASKTDTPRTYISTLRGQVRCTANVFGLDVASIRFNLDAVTPGYSNFKLHPELRAGACEARPLGWQISTNLHAC